MIERVCSPARSSTWVVLAPQPNDTGLQQSAIDCNNRISTLWTIVVYDQAYLAISANDADRNTMPTETKTQPHTRDTALPERSDWAREATRPSHYFYVSLIDRKEL